MKPATSAIFYVAASVAGGIEEGVKMDVPTAVGT